MAFIRGFYASSIRIVFVVILFLYVCDVHSQDSSPSADLFSTSTENTEGEASSSVATETVASDSTPASTTTTPVIDPSTVNTELSSIDTTSLTVPVSSDSSSVSTSSTEQTSDTSSDTGQTLSTFNDTDQTSYTSSDTGQTLSTSNDTDQTSYTSDDTNTASPIPISSTDTSITTTITTAAATICPPGQFPFGSGCMSAVENGSVVITAFILSIISFIGVIGAASYMLFFRKYFSPKKSRMLTNYNVPMQKLGKVTTTTETKPSSNTQRNSLKQGNPATGPSRARAPSTLDDNCF